jgi:hypothetical protein
VMSTSRDEHAPVIAAIEAAPPPIGVNRIAIL